MKLKDSVALVTGGAKRVGRAIALELASAGCDIGIHYRASQEEAESLAGEIAALGRRAAMLRADLSDPASWPAVIDGTVAELGQLSILVNNAAVFPGARLDDLDHFDAERWDRILRINLTAPMALCRCARPHLEAARGGCIINLCDAGWERPWPDHLGYFASKAGLAALTKGLARSMAPAVRVNGVAPGIAAFPDDYDEETRRRLSAAVPLARAGTPRDVAKAVRFLAEAGDYITGEILTVDGGRGIR